MKHFKPLVVLSAFLVLAGLLIPASVAWDKPLSPTNGTLPLWQENIVVTPSPVVSGQWSRVITDCQDAYYFLNRIKTLILPNITL